MKNEFLLPKAAANLIQDALIYLDAISPAEYQAGQDLLLGASIGQHTRHFIEFFDCLLEQVRNPDRVINYAKRKRDNRVETDPAFAAGRVRAVAGQLDQLTTNLSCRLDCGEHVEGTRGYLIETSLERELLYNMDHTIHHLAIIKIGLRALLPRLELPSEFGYMPSTLQSQT